MPKKPQISPNPTVFNFGPVALEREQATDRQIRWDEETLVWGDCDDLPLRILDAINRSPTATSCLDKKEKFITGSGFTDEGLMQMPIDKDGKTLWQLHCELAPYQTKLSGFSVNLKFNQKGKITFAYPVGTESCRFVKVPKDNRKTIDCIKFNPYFGTQEYNAEYTKVFPVFDIAEAKRQVGAALETKGEYNGQIYFYGVVRPPYKFYPVPAYWSGEKWIYVDANIQNFHKENMDNGFFQSSLMTMIGDPNQKSKNPAYMKREVQTDGTTKLVPDKTVGEEFNDKMSKTFSGVRKAGTAMVLWSLNKDSAPGIQSFPVNSQFDVLSGTYADAIKGVCIATDVDPILLALQGSGLVNSGDSLRAVIENQQSKVITDQKALEYFYNNVLLPNMETKTEARVEIKNYSPVSVSVTVEDKHWNVLSDSEKKEYVKKYVPGMSTIIKDVEQIIDPETNEPITPAESELSEAINNMKAIDVIRLRSISRQYDKGEITLEQAKLLLKGKGLTELQANIWLGEPVEEVKE